ncbi:hypothetical protein [Legionella brunensis]|uniref:Uncharacterized protein n=1 Tax=Legionella brunensis TaxID=29422 RepID=A0A0W0ST38_9GAMM|nr:hypothetical protein [Legionella brunensis]KTC86520.1 hypothetical protein Lbru_0461 [Legionella brunensis]
MTRFYKDFAQELVRYLPVATIANLTRTSKFNNQLFQPFLNKIKVCTTFLSHVVQGDPDQLVKLLTPTTTHLLFEKADIKDLRDRFFYNVSPYQLITFLCDDEMKKKILPLVPKHLEKKRIEQEAELDIGGADLVKMKDDPELIANQNFNGITEFKTQYVLSNQTIELIFPLLENKDGIIYYEDSSGIINFYYANRETQMVTLITPEINSEFEQIAFDKFKASFAAMENNSSRRSNDEEHQLIAQILRHTLKRKGICYECNGIKYQDSRTEFRLINAYRTCIRLYDEALQNGQWNKADDYWRKEVGKAQGYEIWVLQRLCELNRPFTLPLIQLDEFKRGFTVYNYQMNKEESLVSDGKLDANLGTHFAIYKGASWRASARNTGSWKVGISWSAAAPRLLLDLIAVCNFVKEAKENRMNHKKKEDSQGVIQHYVAQFLA